jgi:hypothetical protein
MATRLAALLLICLAGGLSACAPDRTDITADNSEFTGPYDVLSKRSAPNGTIMLRVRVYHASATDAIAANLAHQLANQAPHGLVIETINAGDPPDREPRRVLRWPGDIWY